MTASGVKLAVASNKFQEGTETLMGRFFPDIHFVKILGNAPGLPLKPDPEVIRLAMEAAGTPKAVMVGDSATDIRTGHNAGIRSIAVTWGFRPRTDFSEADAIAETPGQLAELINNMYF